MLNLVQLQERLKDLPTQAIMQYANGANPQIPPFIALGELNRRKKMQEAAAAEQAKEMAGAPSIKDQIEQATGIMALQQPQQQAPQQMPRQMPQQAAPQMPVAQMARGGLAGAMNPEMIKKMLVMAALKKRGGIDRLPMRQDMFAREDYARGGIVAFAGPGGSLVKYDPERDEYKDEEPASSMGEFLLNLLPSLPKRTSEKKFKDPVTGEIISASEYMERAREYQRSAGRNRPAEASEPRAEASPAAIETRREASERKAPSGIETVAPRASTSGLTEPIRKALSIDIDKELPMPPERKFDEIFAEQKRRQGIAGIDDTYLSDREKRLAEIQAAREARRAREPNEQLISFLTGIAEARGGNWATQGAAGVKRSNELRAQQEALREKQDMEMEELKYTVAAKRDAIRRGDLAAAEALEKDEQKLRREIAKSRIDAQKSMADLASLEKYRTTSTDIERQRLETTGKEQVYARGIAEANREAERVRKSLQDRLDSMLDKNLKEQVKKNPNYIEEQAELARQRVLRAFKVDMPTVQSAASEAGGFPVTLPNGKTMYFPSQQAADEYKKAAGIK